MNPDLYDAWRTAGNWVAANWPWLALAVGIALGIWAVGRAVRGDDYRTRNDKRAAWLAVCEGRPEPPQPGTDIGLYLACIAAYGDSDELDRLRNAMEQHRKENPQP